MTSTTGGKFKKLIGLGALGWWASTSDDADQHMRPSIQSRHGGDMIAF